VLRRIVTRKKQSGRDVEGADDRVKHGIGSNPGKNPIALCFARALGSVVMPKIKNNIILLN
jgi:hypothetical protein